MKESQANMTSQYHDKLFELLKQAHPGLTTTHKVEFKNVFGAVAGYVNGSIFITYGKFGVALRFSPEDLQSAFKEKGVVHLKYFKKGHIKKEYAVLPKRILDSKEQFRKFLDKSIKYVQK